MKFNDYIKYKLLSILIGIITLILVLFLLILFNVNIILIIYIPIIILISYSLLITYDYLKKKIFFDEVSKLLSKIDQKYLINEIIKEPNFIEGKLLVDYFYDVNKSYIEKLNEYKFIQDEFKEYIELWCHEIKTPIATTKLIIDNNQNNITKDILSETNAIENYVEQVLYYARSENVAQDYIISQIRLNDVISTIIKKNKKELIGNHIKINDIDRKVYVESDIKWLEYIINQIVLNSIKYHGKNNPSISFECQQNKNNVILSIMDNGIGIDDTDIDRVFKKGFTGNNGREIKSSTGMGLYLCQKLCDKLGHNISIKSKKGIGTTISIVFPINSMISKVTKM